MSEFDKNSGHDSETKPAESSDRRFKPLRIWPPVLLLLGIVAAKIYPFVTEDESMAVLFIGVLGPLVLSVLILVWWITFSRATLKEKLVGFLGTITVAAFAFYFSDPTMIGPGMILIGVPLGATAFGVVAIMLSRYLSFNRTIIAVLAAAAGFGTTATLRNDGMWGDGQLGLNWRWEKSPEEVLLASRATKGNEPSSAYGDEQLETWLAQPEWPKFRGANSNGQQVGAKISSDWSTKPELLWKIPVGPGWSSFAVAGNLLFTQEQLGDYETVVCYAADTGQEIWKHQIKERFFDALGGPGPRATPTLESGMLFAQSATGQLQRIDPKDGTLIWTRDLKKVADRTPPEWGFSSSPLVTGNNVIVHAGGGNELGVLAFNVDSGDLAWSARAGHHTYSSPQLSNVAGRECILMLTNTGLNMLDSNTGKELLDYGWLHAGYRAVQPFVFDDNSILLPTQELGTRRIQVSPVDAPSGKGPEFKAKETWTSMRLKPDFNDFVVFNNSAYGFDGRFFSCVSMEDGSRLWKGGRYGKGQVLLLSQSELLLVMSESGEAILVKADPTGHHELGKFQALEGRTWNHPVVIGDRMYIRNSQEAACYRLPLEIDK